MKQGDLVKFRTSVTGSKTGMIFEIDDVINNAEYIVKPAGREGRGGFKAEKEELVEVK